jgi:hypothetical protein
MSAWKKGTLEPEQVLALGDRLLVFCEDPAFGRDRKVVQASIAWISGQRMEEICLYRYPILNTR